MENKYFSIGASFQPRWFWGRVKTELDGASMAATGMKNYTDQIVIDIVEGRLAGDFLWNGFGLVICSPRVVEIWNQYRIFEKYRVKVLGFRDFQYTGVAFAGRGGPFDPVRSKPKYAKIEDPSRRPAILNMEGLYFDESQWDGSDLFHVDEFPCISILTTRVVEEMKKAHITNCRYTPLEDYGNTRKTIAGTRKPDAG